MHSEGVQWFDTSACWNANFIGNVNSVVIKANTQQYSTDPTKTYPKQPVGPYAEPLLDGRDHTGAVFGKTWASWYAGAQYETLTPEVDYDG